MRPSVTVVMPFAGSAQQAEQAIRTLSSIATRPGDQLLLSDNSGTARPAEEVQVVRAAGERSPSHARNAGAAAAANDWILFLDADTTPQPDILDRYFAAVPGDAVGALAGEITAPPGPRTLAERFAAHKNFLSQSAHFNHPYRPRASTANLLVRRDAFEQAEGFTEGIRAAEDTDFCWRLQGLGWELRLAPSATVEHQYRDSLAALRKQWREYAAGRAWLATRYPDFHPQPALKRKLTRRHALPAAARGSHAAPARTTSKIERAQFAVLDLLLGIEELIGMRKSNAL
jgi:GT2 family glycosyltransferase